MQDSNQYKQIGLIYENNVYNHQTDPYAPRPSINPKNDNFGYPKGVYRTWNPGPKASKADFNINDTITAVRIFTVGNGYRTLQYKRRDVEPFLSKQNVSINDFLLAIGMPDYEDIDGISPVDRLYPRQIQYLVKILNKEYGSRFRYDKRTRELVDGPPEEKNIEDDDQMRDGPGLSS